jgi:FkbM family methyltransferase
MKKPNLLKHLANLIGRCFRAPKKQAMPEEVTAQEDQTMHNDNDGLVPYDENLLEHARTQWQFGDWESLIKIERETLQHHPDRAKLALLAAAGHLQQGDNNTARQFTRLAQEWGCTKKLVSQILIAGVHNSLGRAAAINGQDQRALQHFESAIASGSPAVEVRLLTKARLGEQLAQLGIGIASVSSGQQIAGVNKSKSELSPSIVDVQEFIATNNVIESINYSRLTNDFLQDICLRLLGENSAEQYSALIDTSTCMQDIANDTEPLELAITHLDAYDNIFHFVHATGDYIPKRIETDKQFYEATFLDLLHRFHQPGGLIIDGGANIGNHTVYFAKVIGADVLAIEPEPHNALCLILNVALNEISKKVMFCSDALGSKPGAVKLSMNVASNFGTFSGKSTENLNAVNDKQMSLDVPVSTLDSVIVQSCPNRHVSILKLDVEGMELDALQGAHQMIKSMLPVIAVECFTYQHLAQIESELSQYNYFPFDVTNATPTFIFLSRNNDFHQTKLTEYLRKSVILKSFFNK